VILGAVSVEGLPTITLPIAGRDWRATIDTGFNGDLELPEALREPVKAQFVGRATAALAGGQSVEEDLYLVDSPFDGQRVQAEATFVTGSRILIGTRLLREYSLQINFLSGAVTLQRA
jgi:predicted aspartyl protease